MSNYKVIDLKTWNRKDTFEFFKDFDIPHYNVTVNVDVTNLKAFCKKHNYSFFIASIFYSQQALQQVENFRMRLVDGEIRCFDTLKAGSTILLKNNTFGFNYFEETNHFEEFHTKAAISIMETRNNPEFIPREGGQHMVYYSVTPWFSFTSFQHARKFDKNDTIPRIVFGKYFEQNGKLLMPVSVEAHHSLVDGYHVGLYYQALEQIFNELK